jgi:hypothetical protein
MGNPGLSRVSPISICIPISNGEKQNRFAWLRDILDVDYGQNKRRYGGIVR